MDRHTLDSTPDPSVPPARVKILPYRVRNKIIRDAMRQLQALQPITKPTTHIKLTQKYCPECGSKL